MFKASTKSCRVERIFSSSSVFSDSRNVNSNADTERNNSFINDIGRTVLHSEIPFLRYKEFINNEQKVEEELLKIWILTLKQHNYWDKNIHRIIRTRDYVEI